MFKIQVEIKQSRMPKIERKRKSNQKTSRDFEGAEDPTRLDKIGAKAADDEGVEEFVGELVDFCGFIFFTFLLQVLLHRLKIHSLSRSLSLNRQDWGLLLSFRFLSEKNTGLGTKPRLSGEAESH